MAKNPLPAVQQVSGKQQLSSTVFSSNMAASNMLPAVEYTPSPKESTTWPFSNKMHLNGFREDTMNTLAPAFEPVSTTQSSAYAPFSRNAIPNGCGKIRTHNESLAPEGASSLQQSTTVSFSNVVPLNACNASETNSEMIIISKKSFNELCSNQKSSVKRVEDQSIIRDYIAGKENLLRSHIAAMDDSKQLESDKETISLSLLSSGLSDLKSKILENIEKKKIEAAKDNKQNGPPFMDLPSNKCAGKNNTENLKDKVNSSASRIQHDNYNAGNSDCNKNKCNFKFSAPIYNYDFIPSDSETAASLDTSNISEVPMDNCIISNSSPSLNYNVLKAHLACLGLPEPFAFPNTAKDFITSGNSSLAFSEDRSSSNSNDSNTTVNSSSESISSQRSSCDSCLVTSSSTDDEYEENVQHSSSFDCDALRLAAGVSDIREEYSTNAVGEDLEQTESKLSLESILSPMSLLSFSDGEPRDGDTKRSSKRVRPPRNQTEIKPFENGSLYWLRQGRCSRKNDCEPRKAILTRNSGSRNCNYDSLMIKYLMSSRSHEKGRSGNRGASCSGGISKSKNNHLQEQSSIQQNRKKNSNKINTKPKIEEAQFNNKMQLEQLSTNQILAQIGLNVLTYGRPSPKAIYLEKILTMCGYKT
ncbi:hypothetical protein AVEN_196207-1 [Araneus ventricosus]|uniref:Uncharacterized protein n=1 Tax=Araneus ventricosus TaxID=182803 RepID=A0A4Y2FPK8_ARAVE|nr:hypothetical protein AVEN_196207-1 [Araneus ventricosus]